jgi:hypothetical protein
MLVYMLVCSVYVCVIVYSVYVTDVSPLRLGRSLSASKLVANRCHFALFSSSRDVIRCGSCSDRSLKASFLSEGAQDGYPLDVCMLVYMCVC